MITSYSFLDFSHNNHVSVVTVVANYKDFPPVLGKTVVLAMGLTFNRFLLDRSYVALFKKYNNEHLKMLI